MTGPCDQADLLKRIAVALERMAPVAVSSPDFDAASGFVWQAHPSCFLAVANISRVPLELLKGIDRTSAILLEKHGRASSSKRTQHINVRYFFVARGVLPPCVGIMGGTITPFRAPIMLLVSNHAGG